MQETRIPLAESENTRIPLVGYTGDQNTINRIPETRIPLVEYQRSEYQIQNQRITETIIPLVEYTRD